MHNVLYASHTPALKGSAVSLTQLILGLDRTVYRPVAVFSKNGTLVRQLSENGVSTHVLARKGWLGHRLLRDVLRVIDEEHVRLVHLNSAVPFCKYVGIAAKLRRLPVLWHIREDPDGARVRRLKKWIRRLSDRILVVSSELEMAFRGEGRVVKVYNGVNIRDFRPDLNGSLFRERFGIPGSAFVFGIVGTIEERKGTLEFLKAARRLTDEGMDARFLVVGDGMPDDEHQVRDYLKDQASLAERVVLTGRLGDIPEVMAAIDVLVIPSLWEGFPRSLIEAMAAGKPAIATDVGEVPWMIEDGKSGFLIPRGDRDALQRAMRRAVEHRTGLKEIGLRARAKAEREYSIEHHVQAVCRQYEELLPQ
ncbi:MAG: glycosyltransferase family 4 protein [Syntrophobacteraceae bacterium]